MTLVLAAEYLQLNNKIPVIVNLNLTWLELICEWDNRFNCRHAIAVSTGVGFDNARGPCRGVKM